jgi:hypothetical protein
MIGRLIWMVVLGGPMMAGCSGRRSEAENQRQPLVSPSGQYVLTAPIEASPTMQGRVWKVTIADAKGQVLYRDEASEFVGNLNVYWMWDEQERVWLYSSDTGAVYYWELRVEGWVKTYWGAGRERQGEGELEPPEKLYPEYVE